MYHKKTSSLFTHYLFLYLMVALIPVSIAGGALSFSIHALEKEVIHSNQAAVELIQQSIDTKIIDLENTIRNIEEHPSLTKYGITSAPLNAISILKEMANYHDCLSNIILHERNSDRFFSSAGTFFQSSLTVQSFSKDLTKHGYSVQEWNNLMDTVANPVYWPVNTVINPPEYLHLISPMYNTEFYREISNSSLTVALIIKQDYLQNLFRSSQTNMEESILLFNEKKELLSILAPQITQDTIFQIREYLQSGEFVNEVLIKLNEEYHYIFVLQSPETGFYYVRFLPERIVNESISNVHMYTFVILVISLLTCALLIIYSMKKSYLPLHKLADWIRKKRPHAVTEKNELRLIKNVFDDAFKENKTLLLTLDNSKQGLIDHLLTSLICGNFNTKEAFTNALDNLDIHFTQTYYAVFCLLIEGKASKKQTPDIDQITEAVQRELPEDFKILIKDLLFASKLIFVVNSNTNDLTLYQTTVSAVKERLLNDMGLHASIGMGSFYASYEHVGKSYLESTNALDYRLIYGKECLITPDMCSSNIAEIHYPNELLETLYTTLINRDTESAISIIQQLKAFVKSSNGSLHAAKYICYDMFSVLKKMPQFINIGYLNALSQTLNITHLTTFDTIDDFFASYQDIIQNSNDNSGTSDHHNYTELGQQFVDYINNNCYSYNFQINSMAEYFSISTTHMRKLFKQHTGIGLSDYINTARIEKAMQLLRDTDMPLPDIVNAIGNSDVSAFIRLFKQRTGMTPGQYRKTFE